MHWWLVTGGAIMLGIVTNIVYDIIKFGSVRMPRTLDRRTLSAAALEHDLRKDSLYVLVTWSKQRPLTPDRLVTHYVKRPRRNHVLAGSEWQRVVRSFRAKGASGKTAYVVALEVDTAENPRADKFRVSIAESSYAESLAAKELVNKNPELSSRVLDLVKEGATQLVSSGPPTLVTACVAVVSRANRTLLLRRSLSVTTYPGQWTVGINESMKYSDEPGAEEDFFTLVRRGLHEELGLEPSDYGSIIISWFGWSQDAAGYAVAATVKLTISERQAELKRQDCHSIYEHDLASWTELRSRNISSIVTGEKVPAGEGAWSYLAPLVAMEMWRCHRYA